jgi:hypothetical protein
MMDMVRNQVALLYELEAFFLEKGFPLPIPMEVMKMVIQYQTLWKQNLLVYQRAVYGMERVDERQRTFLEDSIQLMNHDYEEKRKRLCLS